ncbi:hypothetical protein C7441_114135 [Pseudaminobacter salicylatoxidans]|uniref:Uncharacterized protein n=2 Tax=Pseudaminobacter salicylatoxidans TaxID=93369 RepID=A0A316BYX8_PSESE|nr:hypothetical protein C7441_114135 [Pseudaminobacter salicylatoxidans]
MSTRSTFYLVVDRKGCIVTQCRVPNSMFPPEIAKGTRIVVPADGKGPDTEMRVDRRKVRKPINSVATLNDVLLRSNEPAAPAEHRLESLRGEAIAELDRAFAARLRSLLGPLADLHAAKRRQAETGGGSLVDDETDRLAIMENAARQDEAIAQMERKRRSLKARIRSATTSQDIEDALAALIDDKR